MDSAKDLLRQNLSQAETKGAIEEIIKDAELMGYADVAELAKQKLEAILATAQKAETTPSAQVAQVETMGGSVDEVAKRTQLVDAQIDEVRSNAQREIEAVQAGLVETAELSPGQKSLAIAERHIAEIPDADKKLTDPNQIKIILHLLDAILRKDRDGYSSGHVLSTKDKLGNLPVPVSKASFFPGATYDPEKFIEELRKFANDPVGGAMETDKVSVIAKSLLPDSVRKAILEILLVDGENSAQSMFHRLADRIELEKPDKNGASAIIAEFRVSQNIKENDKVRANALLSFISSVYPELTQSSEVSFLQEINSVGLKPNKADVLKLAQEFPIDKNAEFSDINVKNTLGKLGVLNMAGLIEKIEKDEINESTLRSIVPLLSRELSLIISSKFISIETK